MQRDVKLNHAEQPPSMHENVAVVFNANTQNCKTTRFSSGTKLVVKYVLMLCGTPHIGGHSIA